MTTATIQVTGRGLRPESSPSAPPPPSPPSGQSGGSGDVVRCGEHFQDGSERVFPRLGVGCAGEALCFQTGPDPPVSPGWRRSTDRSTSTHEPRTLTLPACVYTGLGQQIAKGAGADRSMAAASSGEETRRWACRGGGRR